MIHVWTDGCCKGNPGPSGAGVLIVLPDGSTGRIGRPLGATTNNRAELLAVRIALEALAAHSHESLTIHTDSQNVMAGSPAPFASMPTSISCARFRTVCGNLRRCRSSKCEVTVATP